MNELYHTTAEERLKQIPDNSVSAILSDYPYGLKFMGKKWDYDLPSVESIEGQFRVLKPGAFLFGFSSSRTYHRLVCRLEDAGFEIRDCIMWMYGSGFPKGKSCLKPAYEPIVVCRKPGKVQPLNIEESRIPLNGDRKGGEANRVKGIGESQNDSVYSKAKRSIHDDSVGRWPANVIIEDSIIGILDQQSGILKSGEKHPTKSNSESKILKGLDDTVKYYPSDIGGASRFFKQVGFEETDFPPFYYCGKACPSDRNYGMGNEKNTHPTVKPVKLMRYLAKLMYNAADPDFKICDFYMGSGTTGVACEMEGIPFEGVEMGADSFETAKQRIAHANEEYLKSQDLFSKTA